MTITQTVEIPANRRLIIEVPREIPAGRTILSFTPAPIVKTLSRGEALLQKAAQMTEEEKIEQIDRHVDELNNEALDVLLDQVEL